MSDIKMCVFTILFTKTEKRCSSNHAVLRAIYRRRPNAEKGHVNIQLYTRVTLTHTDKKFTTWVRKSDVKIDYLELKYACTTLTYTFVCVFMLVYQHILQHKLQYQFFINSNETLPSPTSLDTQFCCFNVLNTAQLSHVF